MAGIPAGAANAAKAAGGAAGGAAKAAGNAANAAGGAAGGAAKAAGGAANGAAPKANAPKAQQGVNEGAGGAKKPGENSSQPQDLKGENKTLQEDKDKEKSKQNQQEDKKENNNDKKDNNGDASGDANKSSNQKTAEAAKEVGKAFANAYSGGKAGAAVDAADSLGVTNKVADVMDKSKLVSGAAEALDKAGISGGALHLAKAFNSFFQGDFKGLFENLKAFFSEDFGSLIKTIVVVSFASFFMALFPLFAILAPIIGGYMSLVGGYSTSTTTDEPSAASSPNIVGDSAVPLTSYSISSCFMSIDSAHSTGHGGMDLGAGKGTPIYAFRSGTVVIAGCEGTCTEHLGTDLTGTNGYGYVVKIDHGNGLSSIYGHMSVDPSTILTVGQTVNVGDLIGYVGSTGRSTGYHLHFEIRDTAVGPSSNYYRVNPKNYVTIPNSDKCA